MLAERDPRVLLGLARVAAAKADVPWLEVRLLQPAAVDGLRVARAELADRVATARRTADDALGAAPQDPRALTAKLESLRLAGDTQAARGYVVAIFGQASQPETAYALGALDLDAPASPWPTVIDRLRVATSASSSPGRARAALVCALAKSGDAAGAKAELTKLDSQTRPYPLSPELHAWLDPATNAAPGGSAAPDSASPASSEAPAPSAAPAPSDAARAPDAAHGHGAAGPTPLQAAGDALGRGELDRAEHIYEGLLATDPNDSQAESGLGDVARLRREPGAAIAAYKRALQSNPSYLPALLGLADTEWTTGDQEAAGKTYKRIVDDFPDGMYPGYVKRRLGPSGP